MVGLPLFYLWLVCSGRLLHCNEGQNTTNAPRHRTSQGLTPLVTIPLSYHTPRLPHPLVTLLDTALPKV